MRKLLQSRSQVVSETIATRLLYLAHRIVFFQYC